VTTYAVYSPLPFWADTRDGSPLDSGLIYFGVAAQNPVTTPVAAYWDAAKTQPVAQPVKTMNGFTIRNGAPAPVYIEGDYSMSVYTKTGTLVVSVPSNLLLNATAALQTSLATTAGAGFIGHDIALNYAVGTLGAALTGMVNVAELTGVDRTGVTDCTAAINAATLICKRVYFPTGTYLLNSAALRSNLEIFGDGDATILRPLTSATPVPLHVRLGLGRPGQQHRQHLPARPAVARLERHGGPVRAPAPGVSQRRDERAVRARHVQGAARRRGLRRIE
jgi:hypothetical protein